MKDNTKLILHKAGYVAYKGGLLWWLLENRSDFDKQIQKVKTKWIIKYNDVPPMSTFY